MFMMFSKIKLNEDNNYMIVRYNLEPNPKIMLKQISHQKD